jgi:type IV secretory pathway VirB9-like protein
MKKRTRTIAAERRAKPTIPDLYVRVRDNWRANYAKASIRVKAGQYNYLVWRDGDQVRNFYLGKKRKA